MIFFHAKQQQQQCQQQFLWHARKTRGLVRCLESGCPHGLLKPQEAPQKWPLGVQMTRNDMTRLYKKGEVPGRSGMEFHCSVGAMRTAHSDRYQAVPCSAPPQLRASLYQGTQYRGQKRGAGSHNGAGNLCSDHCS